MSKTFSISLLLCAVTLAACAGPEVQTKAPTAELAAAEVRVAQAGDSWVSMNKISGKQESSSIQQVANGVAVVQNDNGCLWARDAANPFAPSVQWQNCSGYTGTMEIVSSEGSILPLQIGATQSWVGKGTNDKGETWDDKRTCTVVGAENVTVPAGTYDAFKVDCKGTHRDRTYYYAPEAGRNVIVLSSHKRRHEPWHFENISFTPAGS